MIIGLAVVFAVAATPRGSSPKDSDALSSQAPALPDSAVLAQRLSPTPGESHHTGPTDTPAPSPTPAVLAPTGETSHIEGAHQDRLALELLDEGGTWHDWAARAESKSRSRLDPNAQAVQFSFPMPQPAPVSAWRPALYPVPWALTPYDHFYFLRPIEADENSWPTPDYRYGGVFFEDIVHGGIDIRAPVGTPVLAAGGGKVTWTGYGLSQGINDPEDPYGLAVMIRHDFGYQGATLYSVYAHLDQILVNSGQRVAARAQIGFSGETGKATGPHLHFEVRLESDGFFTTRNPELWLVPAQGWGVLAGRVMNSGGLKLDGQLVEVNSMESDMTWRAFTYGNGNVHSDPFYRENLVISDLPAGVHEIRIRYLGKNYTWPIEIKPGLVSYFTFRGRSGFTSEPLPIPGADFSP